MAVALGDAVQACFQVINKAVGGRRLVGAFLLQLAHQFGRHVLAHAGNVVVAPMALQGVEVLLRATQKYLGVKPGWCFVLRCRLRARGGGGGREHPGGFALHAGRAAG